MNWLNKQLKVWATKNGRDREWETEANNVWINSFLLTREVVMRDESHDFNYKRFENMHMLDLGKSWTYKKSKQCYDDFIWFYGAL